LFIVDGIPINNSVYGVGGPTSQADLPTDYGNGASEINQENIESVNVKEQQLLHYTDQEQQMELS
jgi:hypothetical protein